MADAELETGRLAPGQTPHLADEPDQLDGRGERHEWLDGEMQSFPSGTPRVSAISRDTLAAGSTPPCPGLAPWLNSGSTILIDRAAAVAANVSGAKAAVRVAATEIAGTDLPDDVAAHSPMIRAEAAFPGIVGKAPRSLRRR